MGKKNLIAIFILLIVSSLPFWEGWGGASSLFAQCSMYEVPFSQRVQNSSDIIEGKILSKLSFWNKEHTLIFTSNNIEVYKVFKGHNINQQTEIITEGGIVGNDMELIDPSLQLYENEIGIFFLEPSKTFNPQVTSSTNVFIAYASPQGFLKYDLFEKTASDPFKKYNDIDMEIYSRIKSETGQKARIIKAFDIHSQESYSVNKLSAAPSISSFSPTTITAGTASVLTINGSGFGTTRGTSIVQFKNADNGGATYIKPDASQYVSWSDVQIKVKVPGHMGSIAGTGTFQVKVGTSITTSSSSLTISYTVHNVNSNGVYKTNHVDNNGSGGYTWQMYTGFANNTAASDAFKRAFQTWKCGTHINWQIGANTSVNTNAKDGTNVIRFDVGNELPAGISGYCASYLTPCATGVFQVTELDIIFDDGINWNYSKGNPTASQYDFESVTLHELGHGHLLKHVINMNDLMYYGLYKGEVKRVLNTDNLDGGNDVMSRNIVANNCGFGAMTSPTSSNCALETSGIDEFSENEQIYIFPNPSSGKFNVQMSQLTNVQMNSVEIYNVYGECIHQQIAKSSNCQIDLSDVPHGIYFLSIKTEQGRANKKIVIDNQ